MHSTGWKPLGCRPPSSTRSVPQRSAQRTNPSSSKRFQQQEQAAPPGNAKSEILGLSAQDAEDHYGPLLEAQDIAKSRP